MTFIIWHQNVISNGDYKESETIEIGSKAVCTYICRMFLLVLSFLIDRIVNHKKILELQLAVLSLRAFSQALACLWLVGITFCSYVTR